MNIEIIPKSKIFVENQYGFYDYYPCGHRSDMSINAQNSDANCFRTRPSYAKKLVKKDNKICNGCPYNEINFNL